MFDDRIQAGHILAGRLSSYKNSSAVVVGLVRGGVQVAWAIAQDLTLALEALVVKKISHPGNNELALGALAPDGICILNRKMIRETGVNEGYLNERIRDLALLIEEKTILYRNGQKPFDPTNRVVILADDGVATGATLEAAVRWCRTKKVKKIIAAVPVVPFASVGQIKSMVDECVLVEEVGEFQAVGQHYKHFSQLTDDDVFGLLRKTR